MYYQIFMSIDIDIRTCSKLTGRQLTKSAELIKPKCNEEEPKKDNRCVRIPRQSQYSLKAVCEMWWFLVERFATDPVSIE